MDNDKAIVLAMSAAAVANFRPNAFYRKRSVETAYLALRRYLVEHFPAVPNDILDIGPASAERQSLLGQQLRESGAADDPAILAMAALLAGAVIEQSPTSATSVFAGLDDLQQAFESMRNA